MVTISLNDVGAGWVQLGELELRVQPNKHLGQVYTRSSHAQVSKKHHCQVTRHDIIMRTRYAHVTHLNIRSTWCNAGQA
jgi:hypothetical protein